MTVTRNPENHKLPFWRTAALYAAGGVGVWLVLTLVFTVSGYVDATRFGRDSDLSRHFIDSGLGFGVWALIAPVLFALSGSDRFVRAGTVGKLVYCAIGALFTFAVTILYVFNVSAPYWGYAPIDFLKAQRIVDWLGDVFLFIIAVLLGYVAAVIRQAQQAALKAAKLQSTLAREQAEKSTFEASYLRGRLGSHFVMNALSNVLGLIRLGDTVRAEDATILLSELLRGMTGEDAAHLVTLDMEIALAKKYLAFQRIRYPSLTSSFSVAPDCTGAAVPGQLLQPLLENVFKHASLPKKAELKVTAHRQDDRLVLAVINNSAATDAETSHCGEGLTLTRLRLKTLIGSNVGIDRRFRDGWYSVQIDLPYKDHTKDHSSGHNRGDAARTGLGADEVLP